MTRPSPDGRPRFVLEVRPVSNTVVVGPRESLAIGELAGRQISWAGNPPEAALGEWFDCDVQVRAHAEPVAASASVQPTADGVELVVRPHEPIMGLAPGQSAVLYRGSRVLGQATVHRTVSAARVDA